MLSSPLADLGKAEGKAVKRCSIYMHTVHVTFGLRNEYGFEMVEVMNTSQAESKLCMAIIDIK